MSYSGYNRCAGMRCLEKDECTYGLCMGGFCAKEEGSGIFLPLIASSALGLAILLTLYIVWCTCKRIERKRKDAISDRMAQNIIEFSVAQDRYLEQQERARLEEKQVETQ